MTTDPTSEKAPARCWFCDDATRRDPPAGGWLVDDGVWRAGHVPAGYGPAGTVILEARRHVADQAAMSAHEAATLVGVTGRLVTAVTAVTGCDRVYQWATMDAYPHFHLWLVPWWDAGGPRGPRYLVAAIGDAAGCPPDTADRTARRLRTALTHADPAPAR